MTNSAEWAAVDACVERLMADPAFAVLPATPGFAAHARSFGVPLGGLNLLVGSLDGSVVYRRSYGGWDGSEVVPLASATKLPAMSAIMTLVDEGALSLETTVGEVFPKRAGTEKGSITLGQLMSHTSGIVPQHRVFADPSITLAQSAEAILDLDLQNPPGTAFAYGGCGMHVAGRIAEIVDGRPWTELFRARLADPLGAATWRYIESSNPRVPGGLTSSIDDYDRVLQMVCAHGSFGDHIVLSADAVEAMWSNRWHGEKVESTAIPGFIGYGLGQWIEGTEDGTRFTRATLASCGGAYGTIPWIDRASGYRAVFTMIGNAVYAHRIWRHLHPLIATAVSVSGRALVEGVVHEVEQR